MPRRTPRPSGCRRGAASPDGICSTDFLERAFRTEAYDIDVTVLADGRWSYFEVTELMVSGQAEPFRHEDSNTLSKVAEPRPNPLAQASRLA
jgi:hypothetical protein